MISAKFVDLEISNFATGSVSLRFPDISVPHWGMLGISPPAEGAEVVELVSFWFVGTADDSWIISCWPVKTGLRLPSIQFKPK